MDWVKGKFDPETPMIFMVKTIVSGEDFPLNQCIDISYLLQYLHFRILEWPLTIWRWVNTYQFTSYFDVHQGYKLLTHCHISPFKKSLHFQGGPGLTRSQISQDPNGLMASMDLDQAERTAPELTTSR